MKFTSALQHRGLAALAITAGIAGPLLATAPVHATEAESNVEPQEIVTALNEDAIVQVSTTITGQVFDSFKNVDLFIADLENGDPAPVDISLTFTCTGYVVSSEGFVATSDWCLNPSTLMEELKVEAYWQATENGFNSEIYGSWWDSIDPGSYADYQEEFTDEYTFGGERPEIVTRVTFADGVGPSGQLAQVVDRSGANGGNVGLLQVDVADLPAVELADDEDVAAGDYFATLWTSADPAAPAPRFESGEVRGDTGNGVYGEHTLSTSTDEDADGAPVFNEDGEVVGTFSVGWENKDLLTPVQAIQDMLNAAGAENTLTATQQSLNAGVRAYDMGDREEAIDNLQAVLDAEPDNATAQDFLNRAEQLPVPEEPAQREETGTSAVLWVCLALVGAGIVGLLIVGITLVVRRRARNRARQAQAAYVPPFYPQPVGQFSADTVGGARPANQGFGPQEVPQPHHAYYQQAPNHPAPSWQPGSYPNGGYFH